MAWRDGQVTFDHQLVLHLQRRYPQAPGYFPPSPSVQQAEVRLHHLIWPGEGKRQAGSTHLRGGAWHLRRGAWLGWRAFGAHLALRGRRHARHLAQRLGWHRLKARSAALQHKGAFSGAQGRRAHVVADERKAEVAAAMIAHTNIVVPIVVEPLSEGRSGTAESMGRSGQ